MNHQDTSQEGEEKCQDLTPGQLLTQEQSGQNHHKCGVGVKQDGGAGDGGVLDGIEKEKKTHAHAQQTVNCEIEKIPSSDPQPIRVDKNGNQKGEQKSDQCPEGYHGQRIGLEAVDDPGKYADRPQTGSP